MGSVSCSRPADEELVLLVHLMTAGRLKWLRPGDDGPKVPAFRLEFEGGGRLVLTEAGSKKRAGVWLLTPADADAELEHIGPDALDVGVHGAGDDPRRRFTPPPSAAP